MNAGPSGFAHAPVTKGIMLAAIGSTVVANAARSSHRQLPRALVLPSAALAFRSPGELLFGCLLLYYFRVLERQSGSAQYGSYATVVTGVTYGLQLAAARALGVPRSAALPPGPLPLVLASFVPFLLDIPATSHFSVLGGHRLSDKVFVYLAGAQLLMISGWRRSLLLAAASTLASVLYRCNVLGLRQLRLPRPLVALVSKLLGPLLTDQRTSGPSVVLVSANQAAPGAGGAAAGAAAFGGGPAVMGGPAAGVWRRGAAAAPAAGAGPLGSAGPAAGAAAVGPPPAEDVERLVSMGFGQQQAVQALQQCGNDVQAAVALLLGGQH